MHAARHKAEAGLGNWLMVHKWTSSFLSIPSMETQAVRRGPALPDTCLACLLSKNPIYIQQGGQTPLQREGGLHTVKVIRLGIYSELGDHLWIMRQPTGDRLKIMLDYSGWVWYSGMISRLTCTEIEHMGRKPKPPPIGNMVIQSLSTGREIREQTYVDDFDGQVKPMVQDMQPVRELPSGWELQAKHKQAQRVKAQRKQLQAQRLADGLTKAVRDMIDPPKHGPFKRRV